MGMMVSATGVVDIAQLLANPLHLQGATADLGHLNEEEK